MGFVNWFALLFVPLAVWLIVRLVRGKDWFAPRRRRAAVCLSLAAAAMLAAVARPYLEIPSGNAPTVIFVADGSESMRTGEPWSVAAQWTREQLPADVQMGIVVFSGDSQVAVAPGDTLPAAVELTRRRSTGSGTNIEQALRAAAALADDPQRTAALLYSDGYQTEGRAVDAATEAYRRGMRVYCLPAAKITDPPPPNVAIVDLVCPERLEPGRSATVRAAVVSSTDATATVRLVVREDGSPTETTTSEVQFAADVSRWVEFPIAAPDETDGASSSAAMIRAEVVVDALPDDVAAEDNRWPFVVQVGDRRPVLLVTYRGESRRDDVLDVVLPPSMPVRRVDAAAMPSSPVSLADYSAIVLADVPAYALSSQAMAALSRYVADSGGGLVVLGGRNSFGLGGYAKSALDAVLPVKSDPEDRPPIQLAIVLDRSASMSEGVRGGTKLHLAQTAVLDVAALLNDKDRVSLVAFNHEHEVVASDVGTEHWERLRLPLLRLEARGGTEMGPALAAALKILAATPTADTDGKPVRRHVIIVSDGQSKPFDMAAAVAEAKRFGASISAVSTAAEGSWPGLDTMATDSGGRFYDVADGLVAPDGRNRLARIFLEDLPLAILEETPATVTTGDRRPLLPTEPQDVRLPDIPQHLMTESRPRALTHLWAETRGEANVSPSPAPHRKRPLATSWRHGLGRVIAWPLPWIEANRSWLGEPLIRQALANSVEWASSAPPLAADYDAQVSATGGRLIVDVKARRLPSTVAEMPAMRITLQGQDAALPIVLDVAAAGPGQWRIEQSVAPGNYAYALSAGDGEARETVAAGALSTGPSVEFRHLDIDRRALAAIVTAGGGRVLESPADAQHIAVAATRQAELWPELIALAALLVLYEALRVLVSRPQSA
ncbi:MAG: VWA domain-containing protein [Planctomycetes bacterium]|nr:VWA domain-containing protein [Planctomycetota bacterium]